MPTDTLPKLTPTQALLLRAASRRADGRVIPPDTLRGGARVKALTALMQRGWIEPAGRGHALTDADYAVAGRKRPAPPEVCLPVDAPDNLHLLASIPIRPGTKLAALVTALGRPHGASCLQLMLATGWQPHSLRGAIFRLAPSPRLERGADAQRRRRAGVPSARAHVGGGTRLRPLGARTTCVPGAA